MPRSTRRRRSLRGGQMMLTDIPMTQSANALYGQPDLITQPPWPSNSRPSDGRGTSTGMGGGSRIRRRRRRRSRRQRGGGGGDSDSTNNGGNGSGNGSSTADKTGSDDTATPSITNIKTPAVKNSTAESFHSQFALVGGRRTRRRRSGRKRSGRRRSGRRRSGRKRSGRRRRRSRR